MENATAKWFHTAFQLVENKRMSVFLEIMYLVFKSLWILFVDHDLFQEEDIHNTSETCKNPNGKLKGKNKI